jgi:hypothetical protein
MASAVPHFLLLMVYATIKYNEVTVLNTMRESFHFILADVNDTGSWFQWPASANPFGCGYKKYHKGKLFIGKRLHRSQEGIWFQRWYNSPIPGGYLLRPFLDFSQTGKLWRIRSTMKIPDVPSPTVVQEEWNKNLMSPIMTVIDATDSEYITTWLMNSFHRGVHLGKSFRGLIVAAEDTSGRFRSGYNALRPLLRYYAMREIEDYKIILETNGIMHIIEKKHLFFNF